MGPLGQSSCIHRDPSKSKIPGTGLLKQSDLLHFVENNRLWHVEIHMDLNMPWPVDFNTDLIIHPALILQCRVFPHSDLLGGITGFHVRGTEWHLLSVQQGSSKHKNL